MTDHLATIHAKKNCIASENAGTKASKIEFANTLNPGDAVSVQVFPSETWNVEGNHHPRNADGVTIETTPSFKLNWGSFIALTPEASQVTKTPNAVNYNFGASCLVGSFDEGKSFVGIGSDFNMVVQNTSIKSLWLYCWDVNNTDNSGSLNAVVSISSPS